MTKYETMVVLSTKLDEEQASKIMTRVKSKIEAAGTIEAIEEWGKRRLAYPINKEEEGVYTLIHFEAGPELNAELERVYRITEGVLRSLIIAKPEGAELPKPKEEPKAEEPVAEAAAEEVAAEPEAPVAEEAPAEETPAAEAEQEA